MKSLNGHVLIGAPHSEARRNSATHVCADCLESDTNHNRYHAFTIAGLPAAVNATCDVCETPKFTAIVKATSP